WFLAEGQDAAVLTRSVPMSKAYDDALIAYGQNGEAIRPEQGYPAGLFLPGWEGNASVKWLRRIELSDRPFMTREETSKYTDPMADGTARLFSFLMDARSLITYPAYPGTLTRVASVAKFRTSCGPAAWVAIPHIQRLLAGARDHGLPIIYTRSLQ